jgi:putative endonuclease
MLLIAFLALRVVDNIIHTVYVLYSSVYNKIYIGETAHLIQRFYSHNKFGHEWTKRYRPWEIVYCEYFDSRSKALKREKQLKAGKGRE